MFRSKALVCCLLVAGLILVGCSDDEDDDPTDPAGGGEPPAEMVGSWVIQSVTVNGAPGVLADVLEWQPATVAAKFHIQTNSAYVYEEVNASGGQLWYENGWVYVDGNEIDLNVLADSDGPVNETSFLTFTLGGGEMTFQEVDMGTTLVFTMTLEP